ncbi:MAG: hypothetical protein LAN62_00145 [Acidobacteriia bacterium]|nr:hypothetical protein [Terriglobia bacterium]
MPQPGIYAANPDTPTPEGGAKIAGPIQPGPPTLPTSIGLGVVAISFLILNLFLFIVGRPARAQDERRTKVPVIGKIAGGSTRQAFSGKVLALDLKRKLLTVRTVEGEGTEFFPIKKDMDIQSATGARLGLKELAPGTNVIVYYDVKEDRRSVSQIMVLGLGSDAKEPDTKEKKKSGPPS